MLCGSDAAVKMCWWHATATRAAAWLLALYSYGYRKLGRSARYMTHRSGGQVGGRCAAEGACDVCVQGDLRVSKKQLCVSASSQIACVTESLTPG